MQRFRQSRPASPTPADGLAWKVASYDESRIVIIFAVAEISGFYLTTDPSGTAPAGFNMQSVDKPIEIRRDIHGIMCSQDWYCIPPGIVDMTINLFEVFDDPGIGKGVVAVPREMRIAAAAQSPVMPPSHYARTTLERAIADLRRVPFRPIGR